MSQMIKFQINEYFQYFLYSNSIFKFNIQMIKLNGSLLAFILFSTATFLFLYTNITKMKTKRQNNNKFSKEEEEVEQSEDEEEEEVEIGSEILI